MIVTKIDKLQSEVENSMTEQAEGSKQILEAMLNINNIPHSLNQKRLKRNERRDKPDKQRDQQLKSINPV
jgi:hypothetical protein